MLPQDPKNSDHRNILIAVVLSVLVLIGYEMYGARFAPKPVTQPQAVETMPHQETTGNGLPAAPALDMGRGVERAAQQLPVAQTSARVPFSSSSMKGTLALTGGRLDQLNLLHFYESEEKQEPVALFANQSARNHFFDAGWVSQNVQAPNGNTVWSTAGEKLTPENPIVLTWSNNTGQVFKREIALQPEGYEIYITDSLLNEGEAPVTMAHYAQVHKTGVLGHKGGMKYDPDRSTWLNHMGPVLLADGVKKEAEYEDLLKGNIVEEARTGWVALTGRYFMAALVPDQEKRALFQFRHSNVGGNAYFTALLQGTAQIVQPGESLTESYRLYAGPRQISVLDKAGVSLDRAVEYGWFNIISRPLYDLIMWFYGMVGNMGVAVILATIVLKIILFPLANRSYRAMAKMKAIQPEMERIKERVGDNRERMAMEMMALYRKHKINPMSGCWPMLIQIPIFFAFYKVILISFEFRHAPFISPWIQDLSQPDPYFILPVLMGVSMLVQQQLSPAMGDPMQQKIMKMLPVIFTVMFLFFPAALVLYWLVNNILSVFQQYYMMRSVGSEKRT